MAFKTKPLSTSGQFAVRIASDRLEAFAQLIDKNAKRDGVSKQEVLRRALWTGLNTDSTSTKTAEEHA
jgi:hypothetical protein